MDVLKPDLCSKAKAVFPGTAGDENRLTRLYLIFFFLSCSKQSSLLGPRSTLSRAMRLRPRPLRCLFHQKHPAGRAREGTQPCHRWLPCSLTSVSRAKYGSRRRRSPYYFLPYGRARWFFLSPITEKAKAGPRAPALRNAGAALLRRGGGTAGDRAAVGRGLVGCPSPPARPSLCAILGESPGSCGAGPRPSPSVSSLSKSVAKQ